MRTKKNSTPAYKSEIDSYIRSVRNFKPLTKEEELECFKMYRSGNEVQKKEAVDKLVKANQMFIYSKAREYAKGDELKVLDYVSEGTIGLMNAIEKFDETKGLRFITIAVWYIRQAMTNYSLNTDQFIRKTNNAKIGNNVLKIKAEFEKLNNREPSLDEIKEELEKKGIKIKDLRDIADSSMRSINQEWGDDATYADCPKFLNSSCVDNEYEKDVEAEDNSDKVSKLLSKLDSRSRDVVKMLFGIGYDNPIDVEVVAERFGLTATRVGQIKNAALKKMASY